MDPLFILALALGVLAVILFANVLPRLGRLEKGQASLQGQLNRIETNTAITAEVSRQLAVVARLPIATGVTWNIGGVAAGQDAYMGSTHTEAPSA